MFFCTLPIALRGNSSTTNTRFGILNFASRPSSADGSLIAGLGSPDMRTPIAHCLAYPDRIESGVAAPDLAALGSLTFESADLGRFPALGLAIDALRQGGGAPTASASGTIIARSMPRTVALRRWRAYLAGDVADPSLP